MKMRKWIKLSLLGVAILVGLPILAFLGTLGYVLKTQHAYDKLPDSHDLKAQVERLAANYMTRRTNSGLVIAVYQHGTNYVKGFGHVSATNMNAPDARTIFEIGSITKVFTAVTLAKMANDGVLKISDPISLYLPTDVASPAKNGREITFEQLATHTSGLPRLPADLLTHAKDQNDPYADYKAADLYASLHTVQLDNEPGKVSSYSNLGFGLLGHLLALRANESYEALIRETICAPLGLSNTVIQLSPEQRIRLATGHDAQSHEVPNWNFDVLAPGGAYRSDAEDLLKFITANLTHAPEPLGPALVEAQKMHFKEFSGGMGLGWHIAQTVEKNTVHWKNGGTGGYISFIGFDKANQVGIVVLSSTGDGMAGDSSLDDLSMQILKSAVKISLE